jgi:hypothetical protein
LQLDRGDLWRLINVAAALLGLLEQRVLQQLVADQIGELEPRQLQELDRLLQLRRHDQLLAHPHVLRM